MTLLPVMEELNTTKAGKGKMEFVRQSVRRRTKIPNGPAPERLCLKSLEQTCSPQSWVRSGTVVFTSGDCF